jgi:hypothetical protein
MTGATVRPAGGGLLVGYSAVSAQHRKPVAHSVRPRTPPPTPHSVRGPPENAPPPTWHMSVGPVVVSQESSHSETLPTMSNRPAYPPTQPWAWPTGMVESAPYSGRLQQLAQYASPYGSAFVPPAVHALNHSLEDASCGSRVGT